MSLLGRIARDITVSIGALSPPQVKNHHASLFLVISPSLDKFANIRSRLLVKDSNTSIDQRAAEMQNLLNATASSAGALFSTSVFEVQPFQREYSWGKDEVADFWTDLQKSLNEESYFIGLIILTDGGYRKSVVDGQQRLITISFLAKAIYNQAIAIGRKALAERITADFLSSINYDSDEICLRILLADETDNNTFQNIVQDGVSNGLDDGADDTVSDRMVKSFAFLQNELRKDLVDDPFKRLGKWADLLTNRLQLAVFVHPDTSSAYQVFEVVNTRGKEPTTADLLKNYVLSQASIATREALYQKWRDISQKFTGDASGTFVQYIRHVVTVESGHILPKELFGFLAQRIETPRIAPSADALVRLLDNSLSLYSQMIDPTAAGPCEPETLRIFSAFNSLGVIAVRPILLAMSGLDDALNGMKFILRLVVRRIVVGNLGTGNVERRFGEAAHKIKISGRWESIIGDFTDLDPARNDFERQLTERSFNKGVLTFLRRSIIQKDIAPNDLGTLHYIWSRQLQNWEDMSEEEGSYWGSTLGNTFLSVSERRTRGAIDWNRFKELMIPTAVEDEITNCLETIDTWNALAIAKVGRQLASIASEIWY